MRVRPLVFFGFLGASLLSSSALFAVESTGSKRPLQVKSSVRSVGGPLDSEELIDLDKLAPARDEKESKPASHKKGGRPRTPRATLPDGVPLSQPSEKARRSIAEGATAELSKQGASDTELEALRDAEKVLFPKRVRGLQSSWSFEMPEAEDQSSRTLGLPLVLGQKDDAESFSKEDIAWLRSLTLPDLPVRLDRRVVTYLKFYRDSHRGRTIAAIWTRKSGRYVAEMKAKLRRAGLPTDLVWLSMIESGHNPTIRSPAGAVGLWQFMPASGRMYGLTVDRWVDERRDPARSTQAAIRFLSDLHRRFGNWELAMGAYNMGYAGMSRAVAKYNTNDYWALSRMESGIPWETSLYVPKIFALAIVMNNRAAFGVDRQRLDPSEAFDTVLLSPATPLSDAAKAAGISLERLRAINPQYLATRLPPQGSGPMKKWSLRVPVGVGEKVLAKLAQRSAQKLSTYRVRLGDNASMIAADHGVTVAALRRENALSKSEKLAKDTVLLLPKGAKAKAHSRPQEVVVSRLLNPASGQERVFYQVQSRDRLDEIARAFDVNEGDLARWNVLNTSAHLRAGMTLQVLVSEPSRLTGVRFVREKNARVLLAGSAEFHEHFESLKGKRRVLITAQKNDTLARVGARYGMSVGSMERVNRRSRKTKLVVGEKLIVYTDRKVTAAQSATTKEALPPIVAPRPELLP